MMLFVILYRLAEGQVPQDRAVVLAVGQAAEPVDDGLRRHPLGVRQGHAAPLGSHDRHHRSGGDSRCAAKGAPDTLAYALCISVDFNPHRHHVAAGGAPHYTHAVGLVIFFVKQDVARMKEVVFDRLAVEPVYAVAQLVVLVHTVAVSEESCVRSWTTPGKTEST